MDPLLNKFVMPLSSYDVTLLPPGKRDPSSPDFAVAMTAEFYDGLLDCATWSVVLWRSNNDDGSHMTY